MSNRTEVVGLAQSIRSLDIQDMAIDLGATKVVHIQKYNLIYVVFDTKNDAVAFDAILSEEDTHACGMVKIVKELSGRVVYIVPYQS